MLSVSITKGQHTTVLVLVELACSSSRGEGEGKDVCEGHAPVAELYDGEGLPLVDTRNER